MYRFASNVDPDTIYDLSRFAYAELALHGVTHVGEFHYVHHQPDGTPYGNRTEMAEAVVRAARDIGMRITLLRVLYERPGWGRALEPAQRRFSDSADDAIADVEALEKRFASDAAVNVGLAPHSVRAVRVDSLARLANEARKRDWPLHIHVGEQRREVQECLAEHGRRPVELLADQGVLDAWSTAVHATHLSPTEVDLLGGSHICVCRTTERDLGDGSPPLSELTRAGARVCMGVDSHAISDPWVELRALELDERVRTESRNVIADGSTLLRWGSSSAPLSRARASDRVELDADDVALRGADPTAVDDMIAFAATGRAVKRVVVDGTAIVDEGQLATWDAVATKFDCAVDALTSRDP